MTTRENLRARILELVPRDYSVPPEDVVKTLAVFPRKAVWAQIVLLAMEGVITSDHPGQYDGRAMIRRLAP